MNEKVASNKGKYKVAQANFNLKSQCIVSMLQGKRDWDRGKGIWTGDKARETDK